jgi:fructoselysine 6-phosphate deglycase
VIVTEQLPLKPIEADLADKIRATLDQRPALEKVVGEAVDKGLRNVVFVGAGGSLIAAYAAHYILEREASFPVYKLQSDEFNTARPKRIGEGSLVLLASHTGTTKETVAAAKNAREAGATVIVVAKENSPLAEAADAAFTGQSDVFFQLAAYVLLQRTGAERDWDAVEQAVKALPEALVSAAEEGEEQAHAIADAFKDERITYVLGSGPSYAWAYGFAMCYLQEMQWKHAAGFNSGEFFQGAFEVCQGTAVINILGEDASRPMAERAKSFLDTYNAEKTRHIDVKALTLPGIPAELRGDVSPLAVAVLMGRLAKHYESLRGHDLEQRRFMFKVEY